MTIEFACPDCGNIMSARDDFAGRTVSCSSCGGRVVVTAEDAQEAALVEDAPMDVAALAGSHDATKVCPVCGEVIKAVALRCRYCREDLAKWRDGGVWRDGKLLVMNKNAELPARCVKTNEPTDDWLKRSLYWHNPLLYFLIVFPGLLGYAIVALLVRKTATIRVGLSPQGFSRRRWGIATAWLSFLIGFSLMIFGIANTKPDNSMWILAVVGGLGVFIGVIVGVIRSQVVSAKKIDDDHVWLKGVHPDYLAMLPPWSE